MMSPTQVEVLRQLVTRGPVYDGDVASKAARDDLLQIGIASRACVRGEQGYTVAHVSRVGRAQERREPRLKEDPLNRELS